MPAPAWSIVGGLVVVLAQVLTQWLLGRRNADAQRINMLVLASTALVDDLRAEISRLKETNSDLKKEVAELRAEVDALRASKESHD